MHKTMTLVGALGVGAGLIYLAEPSGGTRRRALIRDRAVRSFKGVRNFLERAGRDLGNRGRGVLAKSMGKLSNRASSDDTLLERVRSKMGHYVSDPRAIEVMARQGYVTLRGPVRAAEVEGLVAAISRVPGVREVMNELEPQTRDEKIPSAPGGAPSEWRGRNWAPALQLAAGVVGTVAAVYLATALVARHRNGTLQTPSLKSPLWALLQKRNGSRPAVAQARTSIHPDGKTAAWW